MKKPRLSPTKKKWMVNTIALSLPVITFAAIVGYVKYLGPIFDDVSVYAASHSLPVNHALQTSDIKELHVSRKNMEPDAITHPQELIGMMTSEPLSQNQPFTPSELETNALALEKGQRIVPIPSAWIYAVDGSLRRGDKVDIRIIRKSAGPGTTTSPTTGQTSNSNSTPLNLSALSQMYPEVQNPVLTGITVAYVHNGSNQEVVNVSPNTNIGGTQTARENGSSNPTALELIVTGKQWTTLLTYSYNYQFVFDYQ